MSRVGFDPMAPVFEWAKTVHALERMATVTGCTDILSEIKCNNEKRKHCYVFPRVFAQKSYRSCSLCEIFFR
jgi:hypothetical protein